MRHRPPVSRILVLAAIALVAALIVGLVAPEVLR